MSGSLRKAGMVAAGGVVYAGSCLFAYSYMQRARQDVDDTQQQLDRRPVSFVDDPQRVQQFQRVAEVYDAQIGRDEVAMGINLLRRALMYFYAHGTVLEVGAGTGRNIAYYPSSAVDRVVLTDSSDQMLLQARKKLTQRRPDDRPQFACVEADSAKLSFPDRSFDTVVDTFGLCSYDDPVVVLNEMARVCKPDGKILLLEHGRSKTWDAITRYLDRHAERHAKNWGCVWNRDLDALLDQADVDVEKLSVWHFGTTYYIVAKPKIASSGDP